MRFVVILAVVVVVYPALGRAQVYVNPAALDQLAGVERPAAVVAPAPVAKRVVFRAHVKPRVKAPAVAAVMPLLPAKPTLAPPIVPVVAKPVLPARPAYGGPVTITFAPGSAALPAGVAARLAGVCALPGTVTVDARAAEDEGDPSAALRLSLARALAVKSALTDCGVPSTRVLPRALGAAPGGDDNAAIVGALGK